MKGVLLLSAFLLAANFCLKADTVAQWNFNSAPPDGDPTTGTTAPSIGSGTAMLIGGTTASFSDGSTNDPASSTDDSGWNTTHYLSQGTGNKTSGVQFTAATFGYSNIVVHWDLRATSTASKYYRLQYSTDGTTFLDYPTPNAVQIAGQGNYYEPQTNSLAGIDSVNDNGWFAIRIVSEFESTATGSGDDAYVTPSGTNTYRTSGTVRFDLVTISGTPIPGANTPPTISTVPNQTIHVNQSTGPLSFNVADAQDPATSLALDKASSDPAVIPAANVVFGGSGSDRTVNITAANQPGSSIITLYLIDTGGRSNSISFSVTVLPANTVPALSGLSPTNTMVDTPTQPLPFSIGDLETPADILTLSATSANPTLVPSDNIVFGGSGSNRTVTLAPATGQIGVAPVTISVSDGTNTTSSSFPLMITPSAAVIFYEPFSYADGSVLTNSALLWNHRSGTTLGECQVSNAHLLITSAQTEDIVGPLIGGPYLHNNSIVLYASFKVTFLTLPKVAPGLFAHFANGSTLRGRIYAGTTNAGPSAFRLFVANGSDTTTELNANLSTNATYTLVTRYNIDSATTTLWLNPAAESDPGVTATDPQSAFNIVSYGFRQDSDIGATMLIDDLQVGLSFDAVLPTATVSPIPLNFQRNGNSLVLSWANPAFLLQSAPAATGSYSTIPGATNPYTNSIVGIPRFFRLKSN